MKIFNLKTLELLYNDWTEEKSFFDKAIAFVELN